MAKSVQVVKKIFSLPAPKKRDQNESVNF